MRRLEENRCPITGQPALPNSQANSPSLSGVLVLLVELGRECPEALDRYLPALIKLLSRLTQELNSVSTAQQQQQRILQQQSSRNRSQSSKLKKKTLQSPSMVPSRTAWRSALERLPLASSAAGVIDHKQLFLRMLLQLVNDKGTHGAVLVAILDALCDWVDDAALGPYDPLRSYTISAATTQVTETAVKYRRRRRRRQPLLLPPQFPPVYLVRNRKTPYW